MFRTNWGISSFKSIHFGLVNVGDTFQRDMDISFHDLIGQRIVVYLDDVTMFSKRRSDHLCHLKKSFERCHKYGIYLNTKKRIFTVSKGNILGLIIAKSGIKVDLEWVKTFTLIPFPVNNKSMQSLLGKIKFSFASSCQTIHK